MSRTRRFWLATTIAAVAACRALPEIPAGVCGNGVVEPPETCDGFSRGEASCRPPGSAQQCHLDCSTRADGTHAACPVGWGCAADGVCRQATGDYRVLPEAIPGNASSLIAGDFDGDGRGDILSEEPAGFLGATKFRVHYFDREAALQQTWTSPVSLVSLSVTQASPGGRAQIAFANGIVGFLLGQRNRTLITDTYPTFVLPDAKVRIIGPLQRDPVEDSTVLLVLAERDGVLSLLQPDRNTASLLPVVRFAGVIDDLAGEPALGDVFEDSSHPCLDFALALRGGREVSVYSACDRDPQTQAVRWRAQPEITTIELDAGVAIDRGPLLADVDGDGHIDLLIGAQQDGAAPDAEDSIYVAFGDGARLSTPRPLLATLDDDPSSRTLPMPLAAGDFTGDRAADLIYPEGFLLSRPGTAQPDLGYLNAPARFGTAWSEARVADLNDNGMPDVAAASRQHLDIDFFNGTNSERVNPFVIPTMRPVEHLAFGDFDGDLIMDLAFSQTGPVEAPHEVAVAFGNRSGPPAAPITVARVSGILQVGALPFRASDSVDAVFLTYQQGSGSAFAQFGSEGDRNLLCFVELTTFAADGSLQSVPAVSLTTGVFTQPGQRDALLLASDLTPGNRSMWLVSAIGGSTGRPESLGWGLDSRIAPFAGTESFSSAPVSGISSGSTPVVRMLLSGGDLDADGLDDLVVAAPDQNADHCFVSSAHVVTGEASQLAIDEPVVLDDACGEGGQLAVRDLDGDGAPDIALLTGERMGPRKLLVLWNDGAGGFSAGAVSSLATLDDNPRAFVAFQPTPTAKVVLAYVSDTRVRILRARSKKRELEDTGLAPELKLEHGTGIAATDLDGDGVTDLVVADAGSLRVLRAELRP